MKSRIKYLFSLIKRIKEIGGNSFEEIQSLVYRKYCEKKQMRLKRRKSINLKMNFLNFLLKKSFVPFEIIIKK